MGPSAGISGVFLRISAPSTVCRLRTSNSSSVSLPGLLSSSLGVFTLPMSCISAEMPNSRSSLPSMPTARAWAMARIDTFTMCVNV